MNNAVFYYTNTCECKRLAEYVAEKTGYGATEITKARNEQYDTVVLVFPVYCQNIPQTVSKFLKTLKTENLALIAAYGKMSFGNVLFEIQKKYAFNIIAAAYVPTKHAYISEDRFCEFEKLDPFVKKLDDKSAVLIARSKKNLFANFFPKARTRSSIKIKKIDALCDRCHLCEIFCPEQAMRRGKIGKKCTRCMRCVDVCPNSALYYEKSRTIARYLNKQKKNEFVLYI